MSSHSEPTKFWFEIQRDVKVFPPAIELDFMVLLPAVRSSSKRNSTICLNDTNWAMNELHTMLPCDGYQAFCTKVGPRRRNTVEGRECDL